MNKELKNWDEVTDTLAECFVKKYFGKEYLDDYFWVGTKDQDREVLAISDYFYNLEDLIGFVRYKYTVDEMFEYYDYRLENDMKGKTSINIKNWKKLEYETKKSKIQKRKSKKRD